MIELDYGAKRRLSFEPYIIDSLEKHILFAELEGFLMRELVFDTWLNLDDVRKCRLLEKLAIMFCKAVAPTRDYGVTKAEIRDAIIQVIDLKRRGGGSEWLSRYGSCQSNQLDITADSLPCETTQVTSTRFITASRIPREQYGCSRQ